MRVRCLIEAPPENLQLAVSVKGKNITCNYLYYLHQSYELQVQFQLHGQEHPSIGKRENRQDRQFAFFNKIIDVATIIIFLNTYRHHYIFEKVDSLFIDGPFINSPLLYLPVFILIIFNFIFMYSGMEVWTSGLAGTCPRSKLNHTWPQVIFLSFLA